MKRGRYGLIPRDMSAYTVLGLDPSRAMEYTDADISRAYRKQSLTAHPDKATGSQDAFDRLQEAYQLVQTKERRYLYKQYGSRGEKGPGDHMRETMKKAVPLSVGILGGILATVTLFSSNDTRRYHIMSLISMLTLGTGTLIESDAPVLDVLKGGIGGIAVGSLVSSLAYGIVGGIQYAVRGSGSNARIS